MWHQGWDSELLTALKCRNIYGESSEAPSATCNSHGASPCDHTSDERLRHVSDATGDTGPAPGVSVTHVIPLVSNPWSVSPTHPGSAIIPLSLSRGPDLTGNSQPQLLANSRTERITPTLHSDYYRFYFLMKVTISSKWRRKAEASRQCCIKVIFK